MTSNTLGGTLGIRLSATGQNAHGRLFHCEPVDDKQCKENIMNVKPIAAILCFTVVCLATTIVFTSYGTAQTDGPRRSDADNSLSSESIRVRYARAYLKLANADLGIALDMNKRIGGTYPENTAQRLRNHVEMAKKKLQYELDGGKIKAHDIHLGELEGARKLAVMNLAKAIAVNNRLAGTVSELEVQRLRLVAEVARLAIARGRDPAAVSSPFAHLQWQLDQMRSELMRLQIRTDKLATSG